MKIKTLSVLGGAFACCALVFSQVQMADQSDEPTHWRELMSGPAKDGERVEPLSEELELAEPAARRSPIEAGSPEVDGFSDLDLQQKLAGLPTSRDNQESREYRYARGDFPLEDLPVYESYPLETLEELSHAGDFAASHVLAQRYLDQGRFEDMQGVWLRAAMLGSTGTLQMYASFNIGRADSIYSEEDPAMAHQLLLQGLAAYEFARIRGDLMVDHLMEDTVTSRGIEVTEEDMEAARKIGRALYEQAAQERARRGLPPFDNHIPDGARAVHEVSFTDRE